MDEERIDARIEHNNRLIEMLQRRIDKLMERKQRFYDDNISLQEKEKIKT